MLLSALDRAARVLTGGPRNSAQPGSFGPGIASETTSGNLADTINAGPRSANSPMDNTRVVRRSVDLLQAQVDAMPTQSVATEKAVIAWDLGVSPPASAAILRRLKELVSEWYRLNAPLAVPVTRRGKDRWESHRAEMQRRHEAADPTVTSAEHWDMEQFIADERQQDQIRKGLIRKIEAETSEIAKEVYARVAEIANDLAIMLAEKERDLHESFSLPYRPGLVTLSVMKVAATARENARNPIYTNPAQLLQILE